MKRSVLIAAALAVAAALPLAAHEPADMMDAVSWLAGCWRSVDGDRVTEEQWMRPLGGSMVGMSRTVVGSRTVGYEHLRIEDRAGALDYVALPSGQTETRFRLTRFGEGWVEFHNPDHDFPQVIRYRRQDDSSLLAQIEGPGDAGPRVVDFPFQRVDCP
jgi:hypothetical protein